MNPINTTPCFTLGTVTLKNEKECQWGLASFCAMNQEIFACTTVSLS